MNEIRTLVEQAIDAGLAAVSHELPRWQVAMIVEAAQPFLAKANVAARRVSPLPGEGEASCPPPSSGV